MSFTVVSQDLMFVHQDSFDLSYNYLPKHRTLKCFGNYLWAGTGQGDMIKYDIVNNTYERYDETICPQLTGTGEYIEPLYDNGDTLWFSYEWYGIKYYVKATNSLHNIYNNTLTRDVTHHDHDIFFCSDDEASLYKYSGGQLNIYNSSNSNLPDSIPATIGVDSSGEVWLLYKGALGKFDGVSYTQYEIPFDSNYHYSRLQRRICFDGLGNVWIISIGGSNMKNFVKFDGTNFQYYDEVNSSLPSQYVNDITVDNNGVLWGVENTGGSLYKYNSPSDDFVVYDINLQNYPKSISSDSFGNIWIACNFGWYVFNETEIQGYLSLEENVQVDVNVYPNPTEDVFKVTSEQLFTEVSVHDVNGRRLDHTVFQDTFSKMLSFDLSKGIYFIEIKQDGVTLATKRLVVK